MSIKEHALGNFRALVPNCFFFQFFQLARSVVSKKGGLNVNLYFLVR